MEWGQLTSLMWERPLAGCYGEKLA